MDKLEWYANYLRGQIQASFFKWPDYNTRHAICIVKYFDDNFGKVYAKRFMVSYVYKLDIQQINNKDVFLNIFKHDVENIYITVEKLFIKNIKNLELDYIDKHKFVQFIAIENNSICRLSSSLHELKNSFSDDFYENISEIEIDKYAWGYCHGESSE